MTIKAPYEIDLSHYTHLNPSTNDKSYEIITNLDTLITQAKYLMAEDMTSQENESLIEI